MPVSYTIQTNFASKDSLPVNDPNKVVRGAEFTTEFEAIQDAFEEALAASNPTFSGSISGGDGVFHNVSTDPANGTFDADTNGSLPDINSLSNDGFAGGGLGLRQSGIQSGWFADALGTEVHMFVGCSGVETPRSKVQMSFVEDTRIALLPNGGDVVVGASTPGRRFHVVANQSSAVRVETDTSQSFTEYQDSTGDTNRVYFGAGSGNARILTGDTTATLAFQITQAHRAEFYGLSPNDDQIILIDPSRGTNSASVWMNSTDVVMQFGLLNTGNTADLEIYSQGSAGNIQFINNSATVALFKPSGAINFPQLPTSSAGLAAGDLWNDSGTVRIV